MAEVLRVEELNAGYGRAMVLRDLSLHVDENEVVAILGANGAGKSTLLRTISGLIRPTSGTIRFHGKDIARHSPFEVVKQGIIHVPEGRAILAEQTVWENLRMAFDARREGRKYESELAAVVARFPILSERLHQRAGTLSGGQQQMLAIGRGLIAAPRFLLLDEPSLGLAPVIIRDLFAVISEIRQSRLSMILVEQNAKQALKVADRAYIMENGRIKLSETAENLRENPLVFAHYLGRAPA